MSKTGFQTGGEAVIDRRIVVTVEKIISSGRIIVGNKVFNSDGFERGGKGASRFSRPAQLEPLTDEIRAEMALAVRSAEVAREAFAEISRAEGWIRRRLGAWTRSFHPDSADIVLVEKLTAAIKEILT